jgi:transposase
LNVDTGKILALEGRNKRSVLFVNLVRKVARAYRGVRKIHLLVDNYKIHDSRETRRALEELRGRVKLHFLPPYSPESNPVELVWQGMHDAVTRNHRHRTIDRLVTAAWRYLAEADRFFFESPLPFRVTRHGLVFSEPKQPV